MQGSPCLGIKALNEVTVRSAGAIINPLESKPVGIMNVDER